jgi:gliding motility-associated-like protein
MSGIVFKLFLLFSLMLYSSPKIEENPHRVVICETSYVIKKYTVNPPPGFTSNWIVDPQVNVQGGLEGNSISIKWETPGLYTIVAQYSNGDCFSETELEILVEGCPDATIYVPSSFTPNGDTKNDIFKAYGTNIEEFHMEVFNRWGEMIFKSDSLEVGWDGTYNLESCQDDIYVYYILYRSLDSPFKSINGRVLLMK